MEALVGIVPFAVFFIIAIANAKKAQKKKPNNNTYKVKKAVAHPKPNPNEYANGVKAVKAYSPHLHLDADPSMTKLEDREHDWLAKQIREENRIKGLNV